MDAITQVIRESHPQQPGLISFDVELPHVVRYSICSIPQVLDCLKYYSQYHVGPPNRPNAPSSQNVKLLEPNYGDMESTAVADAIRESAGAHAILFAGTPVIEPWTYDLKFARNLFKANKIPVQGSTIHLLLFNSY